MKTHSNDYKNNLIGVRKFKPRLILNNKFNTTTKTGKNITITDNVTNNFENIQLLGDTYQASTPTPSSPVPIQNVTGLQNVTICGKNLFDNTKITSVTNGTYLDEIVTSSTMNVSPFNLSIYNNLTLNAGTYYISADIKLVSGTTTFGKINDGIADGTTISYPTLSNEFQRYVVLKTYNTLTNIQRLLFQFTNSTNAVIEIKNVMISKTENIPYEAYQGQSYDINLGTIELNKIGDYQDYISGTPNNWVINRQTNKVVLNGSEGWNYNSSNKGFLINPEQPTFSLRNLNVFDGYCNNFVVNKNSSTWTNTNYCGWNSTGTFWIKDNNQIATNADDFKTWLSTHNTIVNYVLATPTTETITNTELINQLNALYNATSYDGTTNIIVSGDLAGYLKMEYITEIDAINEDDIKLIKPILNTDLFRTSMKCLELELTFKLDKNVLIHFENGLKVNGNYEYLDYGDYYVYEVEYQADTKTYVHTCYDKMLNTMISYKPLNVTYPITVRNYITAIASACGLEFADSTNIFVNYNVNITKDYFSQGSFTYRDVLDYLCEVIGGWLYIDDNNKLSVKYPTETNEILNGDYLNAINVDFNKKYGPVNSIVFARANELDNIEYKDDSSISLNGLCRVKFSDNPFLSGEDRENFMTHDENWGLVDRIMGMEFYLCDYESKGITYLELGDYYTIKTSDDVIEALKSGLVKSGLRKAQNKKQYEYKCLMLNDEQIFKKGLTEKIYTEEQPMGENITTAPTDNSIKNAEILVNKNAGEIILKANSNGEVVQARLDADADDGTLFEVKADNIKLEGYTTINNGFSVDINGNMAANNGTFSGSITTESGEIGGFNISSTKLSKSVSGLYDYNYFDYNIVPPIVTGKVNIVSSIENIYDANDSGSITAADYAVIKNIVNGLTTNTKNVSGSFEINSNNPKKCLQIKNNNNDTIVSAGVGGIETALLNANTIVVGVDKGSYASDQITLNGTTGNVTCVSLTQTSLEESKKNFTKLENGLDIIKNIDIYKYNYQNEDDKDKEHIGFVIGENYKYSKEVTSLNNDGVDIYSFVSVCCKAIQEQQEQIEKLKEEIKSLKESDK